MDSTEEAMEHIRFSYEVIEANLSLSRPLILAMHETALLNTIGTNLNGQQSVDCQIVTL